MNSLIRCLRIPPTTSQAVRHRVSYYQPSNNKWPPRFIRRFFLRYPKAHLYATVGVCVMAMFYPVIPWFYSYLTMSRDDFVKYRDHYNSVVRERQRSGNDLYLPFINSNRATEVKTPTEPASTDAN
ncbi:hypothetical protein L596_024866 [Steinernema carpocapsae]|uniref:Uncharacterized protein n=1 Tax=Steinernema carpocapsae TaxID=34508 RepID=A0A4U5M626_STECR|nr:hypothetical protein L596_024866 [Steinernema carpocapsae]